jgi:hypothetical protein
VIKYSALSIRFAPNWCNSSPQMLSLQVATVKASRSTNCWQANVTGLVPLTYYTENNTIWFSGITITLLSRQQPRRLSSWLNEKLTLIPSVIQSYDISPLINIYWVTSATLCKHMETRESLSLIATHGRGWGVIPLPTSPASSSRVHTGKTEYIWSPGSLIRGKWPMGS